ncbi:Rossmann fold nucleotide-binding protein-like protein [Parafrankia sp. EAN1pec]|uniref:TIGR00725 family protein n=1 Tax=Parafrankia sp. (strain EAN1pec) TaxID=298653 RepID=UPI00005408BA|nr:Rossmann fold nucleotide-binding protein-like protein [Frankia sp. EAN1pec]
MRQVAVIGPGEATPEQETDAERLGAGLARLGLTVVTGGLGGVMAAASRGARAAGGRTLGLLPGNDPATANPWIDVVVPTGLGEARNVLVVRSAAAVVAVGHGWGTLSEVALALRTGVPVVSLRSWAPTPPAGDPRHRDQPTSVQVATGVTDALARVQAVLEAAVP